MYARSDKVWLVSGALLLAGAVGCPARPAPVEPRGRAVVHARPKARPAPRRRATVLLPAEPPATYREFFTVFAGGKKVGRAYLGFERNDRGALFELRYASSDPWFRVTRHVKVQTDESYVPRSVWALEMEQTVGTTLRLYTQYDVKIGPKEVRVDTTRFGFRWSNRYRLKSPMVLARYPLLAAYLLARRHASAGATRATYAALDLATGRVTPLKLGLGRRGSSARLRLDLGSRGSLEVRYDVPWARLKSARGVGRVPSFAAGGKPPGLVPPPASFKRARRVKPFKWPGSLPVVKIAARSAGGQVIRGLLSLPAGARKSRKLAAIIIVPAANTRDWDGSMGMKKIYAELAAFLNQAGHAVLRFAPRGVAPSGSGGKLGLATYYADLRALVKAVRASPYIARGRIFMLGHAEGGLLAAHFASRRGWALRGLILVSTPGVPYTDYLLDQWRRRWETVGMPVKEVKRRIKYFRSLIAKAVKGGARFFGRPGPLMADLIRLNPLKAFRKVRRRTLILAGGADVTVSDDDVNALRAGMPRNKKITVVRPKGVGHLLQHSPRYLEVTEMWRIPSPLARAATRPLVSWITSALP